MKKRNRKILFLLIASITISFMAGYEGGRIHGFQEGYEEGKFIARCVENEYCLKLLIEEMNRVIDSYKK